MRTNQSPPTVAARKINESVCDDGSHVASAETHANAYDGNCDTKNDEISSR